RRSPPPVQPVIVAPKHSVFSRFSPRLDCARTQGRRSRSETLGLLKGMEKPERIMRRMAQPSRTRSPARAILDGGKTRGSGHQTMSRGRDVSRCCESKVQLALTVAGRRFRPAVLAEPERDTEAD